MEISAAKASISLSLLKAHTVFWLVRYANLAGQLGQSTASISSTVLAPVARVALVAPVVLGLSMD